MGETIRHADREVKNLDRNVKRVQVYGTRNKALQEQVNELKIIAATMVKTVAEVKQLAKTDPGSALEKVEIDFYDRMEEFWNLVAEIDMVQNLSRGLSQARREISRNEQKVRTLERSKKVDAETVAELKNFIAELKELLADVQNLSKARASAQEIMYAAEELWALFSEFENRMADLGQGFYDPNVKRGEDVSFRLRDSFDLGQESTVSNQPFDNTSGAVPLTTTTPPLPILQPVVGAPTP